MTSSYHSLQFNVWTFIHSLVFFAFYRYITNSQHGHGRLPVGLIAQLVGHCTGIAEFTGSNPVQAWRFSGFSCDDQSYIHWYRSKSVRCWNKIKNRGKQNFEVLNFEDEANNWIRKMLNEAVKTCVKISWFFHLFLLCSISLLIKYDLILG